MLNITEYMYIIDNGSLLIKNIILDTSVCNKYNRLTYYIIHYYTFKSFYLSSYRPYRRYRIDIDSTSLHRYYFQYISKGLNSGMNNYAS